MIEDAPRRRSVVDKTKQENNEPGLLLVVDKIASSYLY